MDHVATIRKANRAVSARRKAVFMAGELQGNQRRACVAGVARGGKAGSGITVLCWRGETVVRNGKRRKMVAMYDRITHLAIQGRWNEINRIVRIVAARPLPEVQLSTAMAAGRDSIRGRIDLSPLAHVDADWVDSQKHEAANKQR